MISTLPQHREYPHRTNRDGTINSICPHCYRTIGTSTWEADLEEIEQVHICEGTRRACYEMRRAKPVRRVISVRSKERMSA
jgi:hypothetical protein